MEGVITCDVCRSEMDYPICFQLNPCLHRACVRCFHELVPARIFNRCPCSKCHQWITSSTLIELKVEVAGARNVCQTNSPIIATDDATVPEPIGSDDLVTKNVSPRSQITFLRNVQEVPHFQPDEQMDPFRHWSIEKPNLYTGLLYVAYRCSESEATFYKSNFRAFDSSVFMDDNSSDEMVKIFARILHPLLFQPGKEELERSSDHNGDDEPPPPRLEDPERGTHRSPLTGDHYRRQDRQHLAIRCMYALSSGRVLTRDEQEETFRLRGTTKNLKHPNTNTKTKHLAKELLKAYQTSCLSRANEETHEEPTSPSPSSSPSSSSPSPLTPPPQHIVHDLRSHRDDCSEPESEHSKRTAPESAFVTPDRKHPNRNNNEGRIKKTEPAGCNETGVRAWAEELGLDEWHKNDGDSTLSPVIPAILWILSAVFILSK